MDLQDRGAHSDKNFWFVRPTAEPNCAKIRMCTPAPGTGKTSTIHAMARDMFGNLASERVCELNASDERGIAVVREKVKNFAMTTANSQRADGKKCPNFKLIILDEADSMTKSAQVSLE